jgi:hypothetical protein
VVDQRVEYAGGHDPAAPGAAGPRSGRRRRR